MSDLPEINRRAVALLREPPNLGVERIHGAADDYFRIAPQVRTLIEGMSVPGQLSPENHHSYRLLLLKLVSLECAAGAPAARCKAWFLCLADLAALPRPESGRPMDPIDAATYAALAGDFSTVRYQNWGSELETQQTSERVLYKLMTRKQLDIVSASELFDNRLWLQLYDALQRNDRTMARTSFRSIADWWLSEYRDSDTPVYDPEHYPSFEPLPNAALALANARENMNIQFKAQRYRQFYLAGLL